MNTQTEVGFDAITPRRPRSTASAIAPFTKLVALLIFLLTGVQQSFAVTFTNNASLVVSSDPSNSLTSTSGVFTVSCWFKLAIPSSLTLNQNMLLFMDRADGNETAPHSFAVRVNAATGKLEFHAKGTAKETTQVLLDGLYVERWYHIAITGDTNKILTGYVDGRQVFTLGVDLGSTTGAGFLIGGKDGTANLYYGDLIELAIYRRRLDPNIISTRRFADQSTNGGLAAYYKLGYSTNTADNLRNFVPSPPLGTEFIVKKGTGNLTFSEVDQAGEQSLFDSRLNGGQNALAPLSGTFSWQKSLLTRAVPGISFNLLLGYNSAIPQAPNDGSEDPYGLRTLTTGWRHVFDTRIMPGGDDTELKLLMWDGGIETWYRTNATLPFKTRHGEYRGEVVRLPSFEIEWTTPERLVYRFSNPSRVEDLFAGRLLEIRDSNTNRMQLEWDLSEYRLNRVIDTAGGVHEFHYNDSSLLQDVTFGDWQANFSYASDRLESFSFTNRSGAYASVPTTWRFLYTTVMGASLLDRVVDPMGNTNLFAQYDKYRRKTRVADALGRATTFEYGTPDTRTIKVTDPESNASFTTHDRKGRVVAEKDPLGNVTSYTYDAAGHRTSVKEPLGAITYFGYDSRGNLIARTNALGQVATWAFHPFFNKPVSETDHSGWTTHFVIDDVTGNLLRQYDGYGTIVSNTFAPNGLLLAAVDSRGFVTQFEHDTNGFVIASIDAETNRTAYAYNDLGWKLAQTNALTEVSTFAYDVNGNIIETVDPLLRTFRKTFDANGNLLAEFDAKGRYTTNTYDAANQRVSMTDRTGTNTWLYTYTARGKLASTTDPLTNTVRNAYDPANRLVSVTAPLGSVLRYTYDAQGSLTNMIDQLGQSWRKSYDVLGRVVSETDPLGNAKLTEYDELGRVRKVTVPKGYASVNEYDRRGRLVRWTDPEQHDWLYAYDAGANITNITDALGGHYIMAYGPRNQRLLEQNQDGKVWRYEYDALLRLASQKDPNGITRSFEYDAAGRILSVTFNTGRVNAFAYDENNNPKVISRAGSGPATITQLEYDLMDRVIECTDAFSKTVGYGYDALGRRSALVYPGGKTLTYGYDQLGRVISQSDWAGRQLHYTYDLAGRLTGRTYPNGVIQAVAYDEAGHLTNLAYSVANPQPESIAISLQYAYDSNGNKTKALERGTLHWPLPALTDETAKYTPSGELIDRKVAQSTPLTNSTPIAYRYDESGNMTNAAGGGQSWSLTYDEDNRTTRIGWDSGVTSKTIANRYDAFGRRVAKIVDAYRTAYTLDIAAGMERTLCDVMPDGRIGAYYIHGPDLCYKVVSGKMETVTYYHADAQANVVALSDQSGLPSAHFAYTPYGRALGSAHQQSDSSSTLANTHLFVGSQGVVEDLPGIYFMRARYYSADAAVFLSTDVVKRLGPGHNSAAYTYADLNPLSLSDPDGRSPTHFLAFSAGFLLEALKGPITDNLKTITADYLQIAGCSTTTTDTVISTVDLVLNVGTTYLGAKAAIADPSLHMAALFAGKQTAKILSTVLKGEYDASAYPPDPASSDMYTGGHTDPHYGQPSQIASFDVSIDINNAYPERATSAARHAQDSNSRSAATTAVSTASGVNPIDALRMRHAKSAASLGRAARGYSQRAGEFYNTYSQAKAAYDGLMTSFSNTDHFTYFVMAQEPKELAEQAYAQYRYYDRLASDARSQANYYKRLYKETR